LIALVSIAVLLAAGLGSVLLGWWGDPMVWIQSAAVNGPIAQPIAMATVIAPASAVETALAPPVAPQAATIAVGRIETQVRSRPQIPHRLPDAIRPSTPPNAAVVAAPGKSAQPMLQSRSTGPSALESGYAALTQGRLQEAKQAYAQALAGNPEERDALLGLAYIAQQQGHAEEARSYYQRVLRQEPGTSRAATLNDDGKRRQLSRNHDRIPPAAAHRFLDITWYVRVDWTAFQRAIC
jgi:tetratricopeptide (TPR) repeat protein